MLTHGRDALLFDPAAPGAMLDAVARLCADRELRERLGREARATVERERLTWDGVAERVEAIAQTCVAERQQAVARRAVPQRRGAAPERP